MQEIVTLACEKWAAGDKVSVVFCCLQILKYWSYRPLSRFCKNTFTLNQKLLRHFLKNFLLLILFLNLYLFFLNFWHCLALWLKPKLNKNIFLVFSLQTQEITKNVQTRLRVIYQRNLALVGTRWLEKLSALKYPIQSMINVSE